MRRRVTGVSSVGFSSVLAIALTIAPPPHALARASAAFHEDFSELRFGEWLAPPSEGWVLRGAMMIENVPQPDGKVGPVLTTRGLFGGERVIFPVTLATSLASFHFDADFQRVAAIIDSALMWHVNVDPATGAQRYYQAVILHGAKPGVSPTLRIQYVEESERFERGFTVVTLAETHGPTITPEGWHHWQVRSEGSNLDEFVVSLDGVDLLSARDQRLTSGRFGVRVGLDLTRWDNIDITTAP